jgi:hypothetical protein
MRYQSNRVSERRLLPRRRRVGLSEDILVALSMTLLMIALSSATAAQVPAVTAQSAPTLIATGQQQLQAARVANTEAGYRVAEATFDRAVQLDVKDPIARLLSG